MIPRYTNPEMGRLWTEQRRYEAWLEVELAAADAMADGRHHPVGRRARAAREGALRHRPHRRDRADDASRRDRVHDGRGRARRRGRPLPALRPHLVGRRRHGAGAADGRVVRLDAEESRRPGRRHPGAGRRASPDADDRAHARRARRADDVRAEAGALVRGGSARHHARPPRARGHRASARSPAPSAPSRTCRRPSRPTSAGALGSSPRRCPRRSSSATVTPS